MKKLQALALLTLLLAGVLLAACIGMPGAPAPVESVETVTPTATMDPSGYQAVESRSCLVADWPTLQAERRQSDIVTWLQGDLIAWAPGTSDLAYLAPGSRSSWFTGMLMLARGPDFSERIPLAENVQANGDLTWSPSGEWLAFLALRPNEGVYTVMVVRRNGSGLADLFPGDLARTDSRSSQKGILGWRDNHTVQVIASCGEECRNTYEFDLTLPAGSVPTPTPVANYRELYNSLQISRHELEYTQTPFPRGMRDPHWSPDERLVSYLDRRGLLWLLSTEEKISYLLDIGLREVYETRWSSSSDRLAIRAEDRVFIFEIPCESQ